MNVANLELCKELYGLSGWKETDYFYQYQKYEDGSNGYSLVNPVLEAPLQASAYPAYDLGYVLQRLPANIHIQQRSEYDRVTRWQAIWHSIPKEVYEVDLEESITKIKPDHLQASADTPEEAACKLAIELFRQGIFERN